MVWRASKGSPIEFPAKGSKIDTWLGVMQYALGNSDSSSSKTKIISLIHALIPFGWGQSSFNANLEPQLPLLKTARNLLKAELTTLNQILGMILQGFSEDKGWFSKDYLLIIPSNSTINGTLHQPFNKHQYIETNRENSLINFSIFLSLIFFKLSMRSRAFEFLVSNLEAKLFSP